MRECCYYYGDSSDRISYSKNKELRCTESYQLILNNNTQNNKYQLLKMGNSKAASVEIIF